ncbi:MAG: nuclease [Nitrospirae bacterium]|nr:nuclease [Candidatus Manganitrophaceae bacterium]
MFKHINKIKYSLIWSLFFFFPAYAASAEPHFSYSFTGTVMEVLEGDLLVLLHKGKFAQVRLSDVDCPEEGQPFSKESKQFSAMLVFSGPVTVHVKELNTKGQAVGEVVLMDKGLNLNRELVKAGLAWWRWKKTDDTSYGDLEKAARKKKIGLWTLENPIPPWEFRLKKDGH